MESDEDADADRNARCPATCSDSEELIPAAGGEPRYPMRQKRSHSATGGNSPADSAQRLSSGRITSRTETGLCKQKRPWSRADTDLSKTLSQVLRHKSQLSLGCAGYASVQAILENPRIKKHHATEDWLRFIIRENAKKRFTLNETGTHVRAAQGHSVRIDPTQLLQRLNLADFGNRVPAQALHSTYHVHLPSLAQHGLIPGGRKGERFRKHIHLATSRRPTAGLRTGSEIILEVDLERAHNSGCTFFLSENGVLLMADVIPPPCIVRATRTDSGRVVELRHFRPGYKIASAQPCMLLPTDTRLDSIMSGNPGPAQPMMSLLCRLTSRPRTKSSFPRCLWTLCTVCFHVDWCWHISRKPASGSRMTIVRLLLSPVLVCGEPGLCT